MSYPRRTLQRKSSAPWDRLRPVKLDPLESVGFVSKGDSSLLNVKIQESYYHKITARYMQFCAQHSKNLNDAFASLSIDEPNTIASDKTGYILRPPPQLGGSSRPITPAYSAKGLSASKYAATTAQQPLVADPAEELTLILTALRKLREGILATSGSVHSPVFSQRVHVFNIRLAILALHPESYHASLRYLLTGLQRRDHPLPRTEYCEMLSYLILDTALRLQDLNEAYRIRARARTVLSFSDRNVDLILKAVATDNWPLFWKIRSRVDGYLRAIMHWKLPAMRRSVLKAIGKSYLKCDVDWIRQNTTGTEMSWEELAQKEDIGWLREGNTVVIRKPKLR